MYVSVIPILNLQACFTKLNDKFLPCATHCIHFYLYLCHHKKHYTLNFLVKLLAYSKKDFLNQPINPETSQTGLSLQGNGVHWIDPIASVVPENRSPRKISENGVWRRPKLRLDHSGPIWQLIVTVRQLLQPGDARRLKQPTRRQRRRCWSETSKRRRRQEYGRRHCGLTKEEDAVRALTS